MIIVQKFIERINSIQFRNKNSWGLSDNSLQI